jgi:hypothetical protein
VDGKGKARDLPTQRHSDDLSCKDLKTERQDGECVIRLVVEWPPSSKLRLLVGERRWGIVAFMMDGTVSQRMTRTLTIFFQSRQKVRFPIGSLGRAEHGYTELLGFRYLVFRVRSSLAI